MKQYKNLFINTIIFGFGIFSSKILVFLLLPFYTRVLTNAQYGLIDIVMQTSNLIVPIITFGIGNAIIRFGLDNSHNKNDVFNIGLNSILFGFLLFVLFGNFIHKTNILSNYLIIIYIYVLMSSLKLLCSQFLKAKNKIVLYTMDGVISTIYTIVFNFIFLAYFKLGVFGYILSIILADFLSITLLFFKGNLYKNFSLIIHNKKTIFDMLKYSLPLIPTTIFWWITNVSDRYIVSYFLGAAANGLYAISYKIPTIVILISGIFIEAWQISAISDMHSKDKEKFFSNVFEYFYSVIFILSSFLILIAKLFVNILVSKSFYLSWKYIPFLIISTTYSCFVTFVGIVYIVFKKSTLSLSSTLLGALFNIILNIILIPNYGINGAGLSTLISYILVFLLRVITSKKYINIKYNIKKILFITLILLSQSLILITECNHWISLQIILFTIVVILNIKKIIINIYKYFKNFFIKYNRGI